ncbi:hypothetical protein BDR26DRAFT_919020 [Obelidium mucronatum]|nr:hypothetical protein BDR26DRAFT_919020 [Obelidium mucronatum]
MVKAASCLLLFAAFDAATAQMASYCVDKTGSFCLSVSPLKDASDPKSVLVTVQTIYSGWASIGLGASDMSSNTTAFVGWPSEKGLVISQRTVNGHTLPSYTSAVSPANSSIATVVPASNTDASNAPLQFSFAAPSSYFSQPKLACIWAAASKPPLNPESPNSSFGMHDKSGTFEFSVGLGLNSTNSTSLTPKSQLVTAKFCHDAKSTFCVFASKDASASIVSFEVYSSAKGWAAIGTGASMAGSAMFVGWSTPNGTVISQREGLGHTLPLVAKTPSFIQKNPSSLAKNDSLAAAATLQFAFNLPMSRISTTKPSQFMFAVSNNPPTDPSNVASSFPIHSEYSSFMLDLSSNSSTTGYTTTTTTSNSSIDLILIHGIVMFIAWGILAPLSIWVARYLKTRIRNWYRVHVSLMLLGVGGFTIAGLIAIELSLEDGETRFIATGNHGIIGTAIALAIYPAQCILGFICNWLFDETRSRIPVWDQLHWWLGRGLIVLAVVNMFLGLLQYEAGIWILAGYWAWVLFVVLVLFGLFGEFGLGGVTHIVKPLPQPAIASTRGVEKKKSKAVRFFAGKKTEVSSSQTSDTNTTTEMTYSELMADGKPNLKIRNMSAFGQGLLFKRESMDNLFNTSSTADEPSPFVSVNSFREKGFR